MDDDDQTSRPLKQRRLNDSERQRAVQACDGCRRVKEKCEGGVPCRKCVHFKRPCTFSKVPKDARRQSESASQLAAQPPRAANNRPAVRPPAANDLVERSRALEAIARHFLPNISLDLASLKAAVRDLKAQSSSDRADQGTATPTEDENSGVEEDATINAVQDNVAHYSGEFSYWNFSQRVKQHVKDLEVEDSNGGGGETDGISNYWRVEQLNSQSAVQDVVKSIPPQSVAEFLINMFFTHACDSYFFVERQWLEQKCFEAYNFPDKLGSNDAGTVAVVLLIFAIGSQFAHLESANGAKGPDSSDWDQQLGLLFYQRAVQLLPEIIHLGSLESVQATLLMSLYMLPIDAAGLAWMYANISLKLAIQNGMHRKAPKSFKGTARAEVRNRVWWTAYCTEKKISVFHGRPTAIAASEIDVGLPQMFPELENADQPLSIELFRMSIGLQQRLEAFRVQIAVLAGAKNGKEGAKGLGELLTMSKSLMGWWTENSVESLGRSQSGTRTMMHIRLEFCLIRMFIGRPFMLARARPTSNAATPESPQGTDAGSAASAPTSNISKSQRAINKTTLIEDCVKAAKDAIEVCHALSQGVEGLARASYLEYSSLRAALLVLIAHCINTTTHIHQQAIESGMALISEMETTGESAKSEITLIRALEHSMRRLIKSQQARITNNTSAKGYEGFRKWQAYVQQLGMTGAPTGNMAAAGANDQYSIAQSASTGLLDQDTTSPLEFQQGLWVGGAAGSFFDLDDFNFVLDDQGYMNMNS